MSESGPNVFAENERYLVLVITAISFLSLFGSLFIILTYILFKKIRNYAYKLVTYLAFADAILSIGNILSVGTVENKEQENDLCKTQAFLVNYGGLASILWTTVIAWSIFSATVLSAKNLRQKNFKFLLFGYGLSLVLSVIPFFTDQYGRAGFYCWIKDDDSIKDNVMRFVQFYVPLWVALAFNLYAYVKVVRFIKKYISTTLEIRFIHRLKYYPLVLVFCWTFATINRIYNIFGHEVMFLTFLHHTLGGLQGLLNAFVYGANDQVKQIWKEKLCWCFSRSRMYQREDGTENSLKKNEEMQQRKDEDEIPEDGLQNADGQNVSLEIVQSRDTSPNKRATAKGNKLTVRV